MEIDAFLCDHAEVADGKLFVNGGAVNIVWVGNLQEPYGIAIAVAAVARVPWTATNQAHQVTVRLEDEDSAVVRPWAPEGAPEQSPVELGTGFNVGRPPQLPVGESQNVPFAFGFNLPLSKLGLYSFVISVDGTEMKRLPLRLTVAQQQTVFG